VVAYWFLEPAHAELIAHVKRSSEEGAFKGKPLDENFGTRFLWVPFQGRFAEILDTEQDRAQVSAIEERHSEAIFQEMAFRNRNREAASELLDPIIKRLRLLRGTALFAFLFAAVAFIKMCVYTLVWSSLWFRGRCWGRCVERRYARLVDHDRKLLKQARLYFRLGKEKKPRDRKRRVMRWITCREALRPNLFICLIAMVIYVVAMVGWRSAEIDFHTTVLAGKATVIEPHPSETKAAPPKPPGDK